MDTPPSSFTGGSRLDVVGDTTWHIAAGPEGWSGAATMERTLVIGELDGPPEYLFQFVGALDVDRDGNVYVLDGQAEEVRAFDADGRYLRTYGRRGEGPGEFSRPTGVGVFSDGRVAVRDPGNRRVQIFEADGTPSEAWTLLNPAWGTGQPLWIDGSDRVWIDTKGMNANPITGDEIIIRVAGDGRILDTIGVPTAGFETPTLEAHNQTATSRSSASGGVPFTGQPFWGVHPSGGALVTRGDAYQFDLRSDDGSVLRFGRVYDPVPVTPEERRSVEERTTATMRRVDPKWRWNGPPIPDFKAPFNMVFIGKRGRVWTRVAAPTREEPNPDYDPEDLRSRRTMIRAQTVLDVFESDGTYLGRVEPPPEFRLFAPVFDGDDVWVQQSDELGVQRIARYTLKRPGAG